MIRGHMPADHLDHFVNGSASGHEPAFAVDRLGHRGARLGPPPQLTTALQKSSGLTITDFEILLRLGAGTGQRIGELTGAIRLSQPALSRAVARLADRGWLTRSGSPADARCVLITLTPAGRDVLATAAGVHASVINEALLARLIPDEQECSRACWRGSPTAKVPPTAVWPGLVTEAEERVP